MEKLTLQTGGAPLFVESLETLQNQVLLTQQVFSQFTPAILAGGIVGGTQSNATMTQAYVFLDGEIKILPAQSGLNFVSNPTLYIKSKAVTASEITQKNYETGGSKTYYTNYVAEISTSGTANSGFSSVLPITFLVAKRMTTVFKEVYTYTPSLTYFNTGSFLTFVKEWNKVTLYYRLDRNATASGGSDVVLANIDSSLMPNIAGEFFAGFSNNASSPTFFSFDSPNTIREAFLSFPANNALYSSFSYLIEF